VVVAYGVCVGSWDKFHQYVEPRIPAGQPVFALANQTSITQAYNAILNACISRPLDALILLHDDLEIVDPNAETKFLDVFTDPDVGLAGVAGGRGISSLAWWEAETVGHQQIETQMLDLGPRTGDVDLLEGSILAFSPWAISSIRFDRQFTGFHGYDEIAMYVKSRARRVVVADVDTYHHTRLGFKTPESAAEWAAANDMFRRKWGF